MLTDTDRAWLEEVEARSGQVVKAFIFGGDVMELAAKYCTDIPRLIALVRAGEQTEGAHHAYWKLSPLPGRPLRTVCSWCNSEGLFDYDMRDAVMYFCHGCGRRMDAQQGGEVGRDG